MNTFRTFLLQAFVVWSILLHVASLHAVTYFVSPSGDDAQAGTSPGAAWKTVGRVNSIALPPGTTVLFEGGQTFTDAGLVLASGDAGDATQRVVIGSYGTGRAIIKPSTDVHGVDLYNTAGITIRDLIFEGIGRDTSSKRGIQIYMDLVGDPAVDGGVVRLHGITISNVTVRQFYHGIEIGAWAWSPQNTFSGFADVLVENCLVHDHRHDGITSYGLYPGSATQQSHRNIIIRDCEVYGVTGDPNKTNGHSGSGIIVSGVIGGLIDRCYAHHNGGSAGTSSGGGPVGIWTWGSYGVTIQRSLVHDQKTTPGVKDGGGFDIDGGATNAIIQYCYSYNNEGPGYLIAEFDQAPPLANATLRYNVSWGDGRRTANNMAAGFHFWKGSGQSSTLSNIRVYNNLVYSNATGRPGMMYQSGAMSNIEFNNNVFIVSGGQKFVTVSNDGARSYFRFRGNLYFALNAHYSNAWRWGANTDFSSLEAWRAASGNPETLQGAPLGLQADPRIADIATVAHPTSIAGLLAFQGFQPTDASPLINAGLDLRLPAWGALDVGERDLYGNAIPEGDGFDIGAIERVPGGNPHRTFETWILSFPNVPLDQRGRLDNPSGDSINNLQKYFFGMNPMIPTRSAVNFHEENGLHILSFHRARFIVGVRETVRSSLDLNVWTPLPPEAYSIEETTADQKLVRAEWTPPQGADKGFLSLLISLQP